MTGTISTKEVAECGAVIRIEYGSGSVHSLEHCILDKGHHGAHKGFPRTRDTFRVEDYATRGEQPSTPKPSRRTGRGGS